MAGYLRDPAEIYRRSFAIVRREVDLSHMPEDMAPLALRIVHACGMPEIVRDLAWDDRLPGAAWSALTAGNPVIADCRMVTEGVIARYLPNDNLVLCEVASSATAALAKQTGTTRSAAAFDMLAKKMEGAVIAIGNAPTALFRLLELIGEGKTRPAAILAFPVGFVGAAEAKEALIAGDHGIPYLTLRGRRGGSAMAAAAINALREASS
jgi:precorrin-8X/cobalt-precorrin-8 methylmutase